jgi:hypothetical protein
MDQQHRSFEADAGSWHHLGWRVLDARTYWVSHLTDGKSRSRRASDSIGTAIRSLAQGEVWERPPTLHVFSSYATIDYIAWCLKSLRKVKDTLLIGSFTHQECRILGPARDSRIFDLVPFAKPGTGKSASKRADIPADFDSEAAFHDFLRLLTQEGGAERAPLAESNVPRMEDAPLRSNVG